MAKRSRAKRSFLPQDELPRIARPGDRSAGKIAGYRLQTGYRKVFTVKEGRRGPFRNYNARDYQIGLFCSDLVRRDDFGQDLPVRANERAQAINFR
jgi:hypothetical protein